MKRGVWLGSIVVLLVILGGLVVSLPYFAIINIKSSVQDGDQGKMVKYINFPVLRENLRQQLNLLLIKSKKIDAENQDKDNSYATLKVFSLTKNMANEITQGLITPSGLRSIMLGEKLLEDGIVVNQEITGKKNIFKTAKYSYGDSRNFSARMKNDQDEDVTFFLSRKGLSWKLTNIVFPMSCDSCHEKKSIVE